MTELEQIVAERLAARRRCPCRDVAVDVHRPTSEAELIVGHGGQVADFDKRRQDAGYRLADASVRDAEAGVRT